MTKTGPYVQKIDCTAPVKTYVDAYVREDFDTQEASFLKKDWQSNATRLLEIMEAHHLSEATTRHAQKVANLYVQDMFDTRRETH